MNPRTALICQDPSGLKQARVKQDAADKNRHDETRLEKSKLPLPAQKSLGHELCQSRPSMRNLSPRTAGP